MEFRGWRARPTGLGRLLYRAPMALHRAGLGALLGRRFVLVHHVGRRTGLPREALVETVHVQEGPDGPRSVAVASGFGPRTDWYLNLRAHPDVTIELGSRTLAVTAVRPDPDEAAELMAAYAGHHPRAARRLCAFMGFRVDGSEADYREVGRILPMVRFDVRR